MLAGIFNWTTLWWILVALYVPVCLSLITVVLLQKGKGTGFAGAFGIGPGSDAVFGPRASKSLPVKLTHVMAAAFMILAMVMSLVAGKVGRGVAPEKVDETGSTLEGLDDLGIGGGDSTSTVPLSVPVSPAPATVPAAPTTPTPTAPAVPATPPPAAPSGQASPPLNAN